MTETSELESALVEGENEEITLNDMLGDAAQYLKDQGMKGLSLAVLMAAGELGEHKIGESYVRDMLEALDSADNVILAARQDPNSVNLSDLADAIDKVRNWGLDPNERMGNAMLHMIRLMHQIMFALSQPEGGIGPTLEQNIKSLIRELGYDDLLDPAVRRD